MITSNSEQESSDFCIQTDRLSGRWTYEEQQLFLQGYKLHGKNWKMIESMIKTRSSSQIRSHAQKFLLKLSQKQKESSDYSSSHFSDEKGDRSVFTAMSKNQSEYTPLITQMLDQLKQTLRRIEQSNAKPLQLFSYHFFEMIKQPQQLLNDNFFKQFIDVSENYEQQIPKSLNHQCLDRKISFLPFIKRQTPINLITQWSI